MIFDHSHGNSRCSILISISFWDISLVSSGAGTSVALDCCFCRLKGHLLRFVDCHFISRDSISGWKYVIIVLLFLFENVHSYIYDLTLIN